MKSINFYENDDFVINDILHDESIAGSNYVYKINNND